MKNGKVVIWHPKLRWLFWGIVASAIVYGVAQIRIEPKPHEMMSSTRLEECYGYRWLDPVYRKWAQAYREAEEMPLSGLYDQSDKMGEIALEFRRRAGPPPWMGHQKDLLLGMMEAIEGWGQLVEHRPTAEAHLRRSEALISSYLDDAKNCPKNLP